MSVSDMDIFPFYRSQACQVELVMKIYEKFTVIPDGYILFVVV